MRFVPQVSSGFVSLCLRVSLALIVFAGLVSPLAAHAQVTFTGGTANQEFGSVTVGSPSTKTLSFNVSGTIGSVEVVTQGAPNLDFTNAGTGTCGAGTTSACTVNVTFKPIYAGLRRGAVLFWSGAGNTGSIIGKTFIYGVGDGGQIAYGTGTWTTVANPSNLSPNAFSTPTATAVDGSGNLYVVDGGNSRLVEVPVGGGAAISIDPSVEDALYPSEYSTLNYPNKAVVDGAGDVWIADTDEARLVELPVGGGTPLGVQASVNGTQFNQPYAVDVDGLGHPYVTDSQNYRVLELTSIASDGVATAQVVDLQGNTLLYATDVWLDAAGDLFISDAGFDINSPGNYVPVHPQILEVQAGTGNVSLVTNSNEGCAPKGPWSAEGDAAGNLFIGDEIPDSNDDGLFSGRIVEYPAGGGNCMVTGTILSKVLGGGVGGNGIGEVNLTAGGDIYVSDLGNNRVLKMQRSVAPTVAFSSPTTQGNVDTADGTQMVLITNIGNEPLEFNGFNYPADFTAGSGVTSACTTSTPLAVNDMCNVGIQFYPQNSGSLSESVTLSDNAQNLSQTITVTGTANPAPATHFSVSAQGSTTAGTSFEVIVTALTASNSTANGYAGTVHFTSSDGSAVLPGDAMLSNGVGIFNVTLKTAGAQSVTATDTATPSITGSTSISVSPGAAASLLVVSLVGPNFPNWTSASIEIIAYDAFGNVATSDNDALTLTSSSTAFSSPNSVFLVNGVAGGTPALNIALGIAGAQTVTATDDSTALSGTLSINVLPGPATHFVVNAPSSTYLGSAFNFTVTAYDLWNNLATTYGGTVAFTSTDPNAMLPASMPITNGTGTFSATLETAGTQTITATDSANSSLSGTSGAISVTIPNYVVTTNADDDGTSASTNCTVQSTSGTGTDGACSLRDALIDAGATGSGSITFASATGQLFSSAQTITLLAGGAGTLTIPSNTTITGPTTGSGDGLTNLVTVNGGGAAVGAPVFSGAATGGGSSINNVIITNGVFYGYGAGGIFNNATSTLTVTNSTIAGNAAPSASGGIYNDDATMTIINSTISGNSGIAGGVTSGPGGSLTVIGTTISGNSGNSESGGLHVYNATAIITNSTISGNASNVTGGGIDNVGGTVTLTNSIVSGNSAPINADINGTVSNDGTNLIGGSAGLSSLSNNGGPTQTMVPLVGSPAICLGTLANATAAGITSDQRGFPFDPTCPAGSIDAGSVQAAAPKVTLSSSTISFGGTVVDTWSASQWVSVINSGTSPVSITGITLGGANASQFAEGDTCTATLAAGANCFIHVHFQPTVTGAATASIGITDSVDTTTQTIALSGTGLAPPASLALSLSSLTFGSVNVGAASSEQLVTVTNTGGAAISFTSIVVGGANASSFVFANNCGSSLAAGGTCTVHGHFAPTTTGALTAAVTLTDSDTNSPQSIALSGTGVQATVSLSPNSLAYGSITVGTPAESQSVTLTNNGTAALAITSIAVTGTNAADFVFANNCGTSLAVGASCTIHGHFMPSVLGGESAAVTITDNAPDSPESIGLSGTGVAATDSVTLSATNLPAGSSPTNLVFGSVDTNTWSASQTVIMTNTGTTTLSISSIVLGGTNANQFAFGNTCGATLAVGATCLIQGHFAPTGTGPMSAMVTITDSDTTSPQVIQVSGTGVTPAITFSATSISYAPTSVGSSSGSQSVTMTNSGSGVLTISSIAVTGADASSFVFANNCGTSLGVGASCTIHGHFAPMATGPLYAAVTVTSSAPGSPESIALSGTGQ